MNKQVESRKRLRNIVIKRVKMNTFLELIHSRHSFRGEYQAVPVKREDLIKLDVINKQQVLLRLMIHIF